MRTYQKRLADAAAVALILGVAACGGHSSGKTSALATSTAARAGEQQVDKYLKACIPSTGVGQIELGRKLLTKSGRKAFSACLAIPKANRTAFEGATLTAAEKVKWTSPASRDPFFTVTVPALAEKYHTPVAE